MIEALLGSHHLRANLLLSDLDVLEPIMERTYGGWDSAAARGWNWSGWFADWRDHLAARGSAEISLNEAFSPIDALIAFQRDNHTQIPLNRRSTVDGSQTALLDSTPNTRCVEIRASGRSLPIAADDAGQQVRKAKLWTIDATNLTSANYISMPSSYGTPQAVRCGSTWIALHRIGNQTRGVWSLMLNEMRLSSRQDRTHIERLADGIVYARLPTFISSNYENESRKGWAQRQPNDRVLIVDLRNNGGGSWGYGLETLKTWIDERRMVSWKNIGKWLTSSCLYAPLKWNQTIQSTPTILPGQKEFLQGLLDRMAQPYPPGCPRTVDSEPSQWTYAQRHADPKPGDLRIVALVNSGCGSDCELFTAQLASLPETIVVGTNTFGVGQFIQPGYSVLPHTGLTYRIALGRSDFYGDNRSFDGYGLDVDVILPQVDTLQPEQLRALTETLAKP